MSQKRKTPLTGKTSAVYTRGAEVHKAVVALDMTADNVDDATKEGVHPLIEIPAEAIVTSIKAMNVAALDTADELTVNIGLYKMTKGLSLSDLFSGYGGEADKADTLDTDNYEIVDAGTEFVSGNTTFQTETETPTELIDTSTADFYKTVRERAGDDIGETPMKYFIGLAIGTDAGTKAAGGVTTFEIEYIQG